MCGIVGMAGQITVKEERAFKDLLHINALRGKHSVGIAAVDGQAKVHVRKRAIPVDDFLEATPVQEIFRKQLRCLIGHNRFATFGKVNNYNAHPFEMEHVVGVHNGSLKNVKMLQDHDMFDVDSEAIYHNINELGVQETAKRLDGAWALVWWDKRDSTLHMWRNEERPLYYVYSEDRKVIFWASEPYMLYLALQRNGIKYTDLYEVTPHNEYRFVIPMPFGSTISDIKISPVAAYVRPPVTNSGVNFGKKNLALVTTKTVGLAATVLTVGTKVSFYIDRVLGKSAVGYLMNTPINIDTTEVSINGISHAQKRAFNEGIDDLWEGVINGRVRINGGQFSYVVQANSVKPKKYQMGVSNAIITPLNEDVPEDTVEMDREHLTRSQFYKDWGGCTCNHCGMDIQFESGNVVEQVPNKSPLVICPECAESFEAFSGYNLRQH